MTFHGTFTITFTQYLYQGMLKMYKSTSHLTTSNDSCSKDKPLLPTTRDSDSDSRDSDSRL